MNPEEQHVKDLEKIKNFRLLDDDFMIKNEEIDIAGEVIDTNDIAEEN